MVHANLTMTTSQQHFQEKQKVMQIPGVIPKKNPSQDIHTLEQYVHSSQIVVTMR